MAHLSLGKGSCSILQTISQVLYVEHRILVRLHLIISLIDSMCIVCSNGLGSLTLGIFDVCARWMVRIVDDDYAEVSHPGIHFVMSRTYSCSLGP